MGQSFVAVLGDQGFRFAVEGRLEGVNVAPELSVLFLPRPSFPHKLQPEGLLAARLKSRVVALLAHLVEEESCPAGLGSGVGLGQAGLW